MRRALRTGMALQYSDPGSRVELYPLHALEVSRDHVERGIFVRLHRGARPARGPVTPSGGKRLAADRDVADSAAHPLPRGNGVAQTADSHHVAALAVVWVRVEQVVCDVLHQLMNLRSR